MDKSTNRLFRFASLSAACAIFAVIVLGGVVRVTASGGACADWPACFGSITLSPDVLASNTRLALDYSHRLLTALAVPLVLLVGFLAWRNYRTQRLFITASSATVVILGLQIILGALVSRQDLPWSSGLHMGLSLLTLALLVPMAVLSFYPAEQIQSVIKFSFVSRLGRQSLMTATMLFALLVSGSIVAGLGDLTACSSWPLCSGLSLPGSAQEAAHLIHRAIVLVTGVLVVQIAFSAWKRARFHPLILTSASVVFVLFTSQALLGAKLVQGFPPYLLGLHQATSVALWAAAIVLVTAVGAANLTNDDELASAQSIVGRKGLWRDLLLLTKPIVVLLLLVTTFAGMVIGAKAWPSFSLALWTLLGGFMAAGGSGAINQYIDREDDVKMQRTQKRPIPSGRLTPGEGLAFGVALSLGSFYLMTGLVNFTAALLSLVGIFYYVVLYSLILKKTTVQNIVIGGGAGALPPLVGWAAATGSLNIPSLFLFAVIFMWTPPHFWALALVRKNDYARAGVPMLPVIRGEQETRWQILIYTVELVGLTLLLPLFGLGGSIYFVGAAVLGGWLLVTALKVWRQGGNKLAWKMYRYSSMYLAFLFVVLMVDALL